MARKSFSQTTAADVDVDNLPGYVTFVKIQDLIELPIEITSAVIVPSSFDPEGKKTQAKIQFIYLDEYGDPLTPEDEVDEDTVYQFTTEHRAIKEQVQSWLTEGVQWGKDTVGPVTIAIYGEENAHGTHPLCFAEIVPIARESKRNTVRPTPPVRPDTSEDANRQRLAGRSIPARKSTR